MKTPLTSIPISFPREVARILEQCPDFTLATSPDQILEAAAPPVGQLEVAYEVPGRGRVVEAYVCRVRNGLSANYVEPYMRRRDPDCMVIADDLPTNKKRFVDRFGKRFDELREQTFRWLSSQPLMLFAFIAGAQGKGVNALVIAPSNAGFFAFGLSLLQGILSQDELRQGFTPQAVIYVAPPFRHTHFDGRQVVVHNRRPGMHELFSYNLYPGPSAKKGVYGVLINIGEREGWVTAHCSTVQVVTPYDNTVTFMHEGASGGGKSEMLEHIHRQPDGRLLLGENVLTGDRRYLSLPRGCEIHPVTDDMALCHPSLQGKEGKLTLMDAEDAWFVRVNHITGYGTDPHLEKLTIKPPRPLLFLNIDAVPNSTALIWEHIFDEPGKPCPNPRIILPRQIVPGVVNGPVTVDIRSFGVRTPPCTRQQPTYGIFGLFHILPPALAWLWRLVAPRGHANPSIVSAELMSSEGVGSYWPFATGRRVDQANLLLEQIRQTPRTGFVLLPNQHIGAWRVGFMPQWIAREYLARRGSARFRPDQIAPARCSLLGYVPRSLQVEGTMIPPWFLDVTLQPEVGPEGYDAGAAMLREFFYAQLKKFLEPDLAPLGRKIVECCLAGGTVQELADLLPGE
ncbi:MAG: DUF4914 family protein [Phycisphaerae bacterium]|nr:DUF4914 family protein [Phycisphaerae bacterium]MDW8261526.1 DUF4914 family protein [Phycisphaerales bacterium]